MKRLHKAASEGDMARLILVVKSVNLPYERVNRLILGHATVEKVHYFLKNEDPREDQKRSNGGIGRPIELYLAIRIDPATVLQAETGEVPHVLVLFGNEKVKKLRQVLEARCMY